MAKKRSNGGSDEQLEVLRAIWNEMKALNARLDTTNERLDALSEGLDALREELKNDFNGPHRQGVESEVRLATATTQLSTDVEELVGLIRDWRTEHRADRSCAPA
jgi:hypothetical protein